MKKWILLVSILALAACSSTPKEEETSSEAPAMADSTASEPAPAPADKTESMAADTGSNMEGGFPDVEGTERSGATCKNGGDERMISVIDTKEGPCGVVYTKSGNKKTVAYAKNDMGFCDKVYQNIVGNLSSGGFDCGGAAATPTPQKEEPAAEQAPATEEAPAEDAQ